MYNQILKNFSLKDNDILNVYPYGSYVYETFTNSSDYDFIIVSKNDMREFSLESGNLNIHIYSVPEFKEQLGKQKISALECLFLPETALLKNSMKFDFKLDKSILRSSISEKASHSWVKAKKKFEVEKDRNIYIAKKSLFHSLRIIDFGIQIAKYGKIMSYSSSNDLWNVIIANPSESWEDYKNSYQKVFNEKMTEFRKVATKK